MKCYVLRDDGLEEETSTDYTRYVHPDVIAWKEKHRKPPRDAPQPYISNQTPLEIDGKPKEKHPDIPRGRIEDLTTEFEVDLTF